jgi:hypothetical protein
MVSARRIIKNEEIQQEEYLFKAHGIEEANPEMIGYCPGCDQAIMEGQPVNRVLGQLYHALHAPRAERGK